VFVDGGDGLEHRTAWAGAGDGVLFFDVGGDGEITEQREYVFTEWDPTAGSDLEALASYFDTNGDGKLDANDDEWANFKVMVTNADGTTTALTLVQLGITEVDLMGVASKLARVKFWTPHIRTKNRPSTVRGKTNGSPVNHC